MEMIPNNVTYSYEAQEIRYGRDINKLLNRISSKDVKIMLTVLSSLVEPVIDDRGVPKYDYDNIYMKLFVKTYRLELISILFRREMYKTMVSGEDLYKSLISKLDELICPLSPDTHYNVYSRSLYCIDEISKEMVSVLINIP